MNIKKPWLNIPDDISEFVGFVYLIRNNKTKRYYIGQKKFFTNTKLKPLKGNINKRHRLKESNWLDYCGSSKELLKDIENNSDDFERIILYLCKSKSEMNYYELIEQINRNVLFDPYSYNGIINVRISKNQINFGK